MYSREHRHRKAIVKMDPDCAICHAPAAVACDCEAKGLDVAIKQAEDRMMRTIYSEIRTWVRGHAQDYILEYFRLLADRRKTAHSNHLDQITAQAYYHYNAPPHPNQIADAQASLKRGIDEDWQSSVQRYPEVLEYFFGLVELSLPSDDEPAVQDPPLSALNGHRKGGRRNGGGPSSTFDASQALTSPHYLDRNHLPSRTPPPPDRHATRTPGRDRRGAMRNSLPPQPGPYYAHAPYMNM